jgi:hypothetical protein
MVPPMDLEAGKALGDGRGAGDGRGRVPLVAASVRRPAVLGVIGLGVLLEGALAALTTQFDPIHVYAMPGAVGILVVVAAALVGGALVGAVVAACGSVVFALVAASQLPTPLLWRGVPLVVTWIVIGLAVGYAADLYRRRLAVTSARELAAQRDVLALHRRLVEGLTPRALPVGDPRLEVLVRYEPGQTHVDLGGDFLDVIEGDDGSIAFVVGDVAGHGPAEAALGAQLRAAWRALAAGGAQPGEALEGLERLIALEPSADVYATALGATLAADRQSLVLSSAGHPLPILLHDHGAPARILAAAGPALGTVGGGVQRTDQRVELPPRYALLLFTDGLFEGRAAPGSAERVGAPGLMQMLADARAARFGKRQLDALLRALRERHGGALPDDVAVLLLRRRS